MSRRRSPREPSTVFHMKTRSRAQKGNPESSNPSGDTSSTSSLSSPPSSRTPPTPPRNQKRKLSETDLGEPEHLPTAKRLSPDSKSDDAKQSTDTVEVRTSTVETTTLAGPEGIVANPTTSNTDVTARKRPASNSEDSETRSPRRPAKGATRARKGGQGNGANNRRGKLKGRRGRGGDSPEPPNRRRPMTQDERVEISMLKARQHELKRFFSVVGAQQVDILEQLASRDLSKLARKPKAHEKVPEYDTIVENLDATMQDIQDMIRTRNRIQVEHEMQRMEQEKHVIEQQFRTHVTEARDEHLTGAEGDIILFQRAYREAHDETHTETGSDFDGYPQYHELPEPDTQPRGYVSRKIMDEKPFKLQLTTYDEQARQQVLNEDFIAPLLREMEERDREYHEEQERKKSQNLSALTSEAARELETIRENERPPQVDGLHDSAGSYALSTLADVSEWMSQSRPQHQFSYATAAPVSAPTDSFDQFPRRYSPHLGPVRAFGGPASRHPAFKHVLNVDTTSAPPVQAPLSATEKTDRNSSQGVSSGPGQPLAPAPPKAGPSFQVFRHNNGRHGYASAPPLTGGGGPQQFIFQPPQQPLQYQPAPGRTPPPSQYGAGGSGSSRGDRAGRSSMTFVNQTIASRDAAAGNPNPKGGQRILLPKM
ncbi:hypothetical protein LTR47_001015 [Exophiala xenobiotica]|nr:hypothetical protein LTR47_001015 [Exophiala xenobiotica]KAK5255042.1 hypothetical protein LTS06_000826 [Exophiala xenobiotica]KAK5355674.1 hypothetical protein LTR61_001347 [Exophiala xenobiotica]KAK5385429.1 hypothetical protein LTR11_001802 [Exophiala xenobiotica]KAK5386639.1 hypothetical protein LTS03_001913 [Exophiala xenobiotica]